MSHYGGGAGLRPVTDRGASLNKPVHLLIEKGEGSSHDQDGPSNDVKPISKIYNHLLNDVEMEHQEAGEPTTLEKARQELANDGTTPSSTISAILHHIQVGGRLASVFVGEAAGEMPGRSLHITKVPMSKPPEYCGWIQELHIDYSLTNLVTTHDYEFLLLRAVKLVSQSQAYLTRSRPVVGSVTLSISLPVPASRL